MKIITAVALMTPLTLILGAMLWDMVKNSGWKYILLVLTGMALVSASTLAFIYGLTMFYE